MKSFPEDLNRVATLERREAVRVPSSGGRRPYIDWARGIAVLLMIEAHTVDAWTRAADRRAAGFRDAIVLGGFAAPLFLFLAGLALALSAASKSRREGSRRAAAEALTRRGLEIFILAFLFRLQGLIVTPGGYLVTLFRVDILNIMGPAIVACALIWWMCRSTGAAIVAYASIAAMIALGAPIVRTMGVVDALPLWMQWYVRPAGDLTAFTAFPWTGFVFAGSAVGVAAAAIDGPRATRRFHLQLAAIGAVLVAVGFYTASRPAVYAASSFWTTSPTYFAIRLGIMVSALACLYFVESGTGPRAALLEPLERFGRRSLFVYWIHVELVYGYATWPIHGRLPLWTVAAAYFVFIALIYGAVLARDRFVRFQARRRTPALGHSPELSRAAVAAVE